MELDKKYFEKMLGKEFVSLLVVPIDKKSAMGIVFELIHRFDENWKNKKLGIANTLFVERMADIIVYYCENKAEANCR